MVGRVIEDLVSLLPRVKGVLLRLFGENVTATVHSLRFAYRIRFAKPVEPDLAIVDRCLSAGDFVIDVGANGGDWAAVLARAVGKTGTVLAFEADPYYSRVTRRALALAGLGRVRVFDFGLSDEDARGHLQVVFDDGLRASGLGQLVEKSARTTVEVSLRTLDSVLAELPVTRPPRLIKCDVEGHELQVLRGAPAALRHRPMIIAEVVHSGTLGDTSVALQVYLADFGYRMFVVNGTRTGLEREPVFGDRPGFPNRWFLCSDDEERLRSRGVVVARSS